MTKKGEKSQADSALPDARELTINASKGHLGVTLEDTSFGTGVGISQLHPSDLFAQVGFKVGDVLLSVDGKAVNTHADAFAAMDRAGASLQLEYWTAAEVEVIAAIKGPAKKSGSWGAMGIVMGLVALIALGGGAYYVQLTMLQDSATPAAKAAARPMGPPSATPAMPGMPPAPKMKASGKNGEAEKDLLERASNPSVDLDEVSEYLDTLTRDQLIARIRKKVPDWAPEEAHTADLIRDKLMAQIEGARAAHREHAAKYSPDVKAKKAMRQLKLKDADALQSMLADVGITFPPDASAKALREIALKEDALSKWEELPDRVKLQKNREQAAKLAAAATAAERQRQREKEDNEDMDPNMKRMQEKMHKPEWERDVWTQEDEDESLERLSKLPMYKAADPSMLENMMKAVRKDKSMLDMLEGESRMTKIMAEATEGGKTLTLGDMKRLGASVTRFDKTRTLDEISLDASGTFS